MNAPEAGRRGWKQMGKGRGEEGLAAARVGIAHELGMADAIVYATALTFRAELVTSDAHFVGLPGVRYYPCGGSGV
jgi:predicted nucleic acid-binding protein